jgi:hypothetical protein
MGGHPYHEVVEACTASFVKNRNNYHTKQRMMLHRLQKKQECLGLGEGPWYGTHSDFRPSGCARNLKIVPVSVG